MQENEKKTEGNALKPYLTTLGAFSLAVGTAIGWGSLVVTNNEYLLKAGPLGSALGMLIGAVVMFIMARNFAYLIERYPDAGGVYAYIKIIFGYDRAFLISWFLSLTYMAMLWANATSVPLFARYFLGDIFRFGFMYRFMGYDIYVGEILITLCVLLLFGAVCMKSTNIMQGIVIGTVLVFCAGITIAFIGVMFGAGGRGTSFEPVFLPDTSVIGQVLKIAFITPWAFVGFESISHSSEEYVFPKEKVLKIFRNAIIVTTILYLFVLLMSVTAYPAEYGSWFEYISDLDNQSGLKGLPAFYAAYTYLGTPGVVILMLSLLGLVFSSLIGNMVSLSRLFYALSRDKILPKRYSRLDDSGIPVSALVLVMLLTLPIMFAGRTAVGWIVDVTTIGAILLYGFSSAASLKSSKETGNSTVQLTSLMGIGIMVIFGIYVMITSTFGLGGMSRESQFIFIIWAVLGLFYFRFVMVRDHGRRFGKNLTVWIVLMVFIFALTMILVCEECYRISADNLLAVRNHYTTGAHINSVQDEPFMIESQRNMMIMILGSAAAVIGAFSIALGTMLSNWFYVRKCEDETNQELGKVKTIAYQDPLTGVKSKHAYVEYEDNLEHAIDNGTQEEFALLVCDVNGLKHVNDTLGHKAGDQYIRDAARLISEKFKHSPVFRTGGDEFVVLMNGQDYPERNELVYEFNRQIEQNVGTDRVVISAGLSEYVPGQDASYHAVFERGDKLMYERKMELKSMGAITRD